MALYKGNETRNKSIAMIRLMIGTSGKAAISGEPACQSATIRRISRDNAAMRVLSVNCGLPREVDWHGRTVLTGIYKEPVRGRVTARKLDLDGDRQADLSVHGGKDKAVYCYPAAHYDYWKKQLPGRELSTAIFGENLTTEGLAENTVHLGDKFSIGSAEMTVTQPRLPCYKLGLRFGSDNMVKRFLASRRTGFYFAVTREGDVGANDEIKVISRDPQGVPVSEITRLYIAKEYDEEDVASLRRALRVAALPESWKEYFRERLSQIHT
jgi:MOSC domain-containing protein YiiM